MEDYYYFPTTLEATPEISTSFRIVHSSRKRCSPSPRPRRTSSSRDNDAGELRPHYLDTCFRCARILAANRDIFMYRGDTPFCSEECRQQQINTDEVAEKRSNQSAAATREQQKNTHRVPVWAR
ncbi:FCS-Like Zinc finger 3 [Lolium perenne]|uniref:FCS-Like Zinc finger 3 n=1 Tax=Lolium perenne TaxID=4522 RepID=UPI0021EB1EFE|nr:FCS-Like Zinc finger 3-like [Lolium perenne]